jgi:glutathione S-transferase
MITLCGIPMSNYYNKVKLVLLEKGLPFTEERVGTGKPDEAVLRDSPLGKIPFIRTGHGALCESQVIADYLEAICPQPPLLPADPFAAAKVRELCVFIDLHLELVARELYAQAFFGGQVGDDTKERVRTRLAKSIPGLPAAGEVRALCRRRRVHAGRLFGAAEPAAGGDVHPPRAR